MNKSAPWLLAVAGLASLFLGILGAQVVAGRRLRRAAQHLPCRRRYPDPNLPRGPTPRAARARPKLP